MTTLRPPTRPTWDRVDADTPRNLTIIVSNGNWCDYGQLMGDTFCGKGQTFPLSEMGPVVWSYMPEGG